MAVKQQKRAPQDGALFCAVVSDMRGKRQGRTPVPERLNTRARLLHIRARYPIIVKIKCCPLLSRIEYGNR